MFDSSFKEMKKLRDYVAKITGEKCQFFFDNKNKAQWNMISDLMIISIDIQPMRQTLPVMGRAADVL